MTRLDQRLSAQRQTRIKRSVIVVTGLLFFALVTAASYFLFSSGLDKNKNKRTGNFISAQDKVNILVMGVDERSDDVGRSDTMFVITVDTKTKSVALLSIPRDTRLKIPGHGWDKINHAYAYGGHKLTQQSVEELLGIPIDHYVMINFKGFQKIVDAIGGVDIDVEKRMYYEDPYDGPDGFVIDLRPGVQHMDGHTAIQYVRYRDEEGDIGRIQRQQKFIKALFKEVASPSIITKVPAIIKEVSSTISSDMSTAEMINLAQILNDAYKQGLKTDMVPGKPAYIDDISYWLPDLMALRQHIAQTLGVAMNEKYLAAARSEAGEYEKSIPKEMKIVEVPKKVQPPPKPSTDANKPKTTDKPSSSSLASTQTVPAKIRVEVVNASGAADAGSKMASILRDQGFEVARVSSLTTPQKNTVIISNTTNSAVVGKLSDLPFAYALQVSKDDGKGTQATVVIGKDFADK